MELAGAGEGEEEGKKGSLFTFIPFMHIPPKNRLYTFLKLCS